MNKNLGIKIKAAHHFLHHIREVYKEQIIYIAWTGGKDSTVLLHLIRCAFKNTIPFPVFFNDSTMEFDEIYKFVTMLKKRWQLQLTVFQHDTDLLRQFQNTKNIRKKQDLARLMKIDAITRFIAYRQVEAFIVGIRRDEHPARSKETQISMRKDHVRIHPILDFTEQDIWEYIRSYNIPYVSLYDKGYRSLGEKPFTSRVFPGESERAGREHDKEHMMEKLRNMGYW